MALTLKTDIRSKIWFLAWPAILEMVLHMMVGIVDVAMVGRLSPEAIAATSLAGLIYFSAVFLLASIGLGATILVSRAIGAGNLKQAQKVAGQALLFGVLVGAFVTLIGFNYAPTLMNLFKVKPEIINLGIQYLKIVIIPTAFMLLLFIGNAVLRGTGNTKLPLKMAIITNSLNIVGNYLLIFGKFGFPELGVQGAAVATAVAHTTGSIILLVLLLRGSNGFKIPVRSLLKIDLPIQKQLIGLSLPAAAEEGIYSLGRIVSSFLLTGLGTITFAANQVALSVESLSFMPGYGFAIATTTLVGQRLGAKRPDESELYAKEGAKLALLVMSAIGLVFLLFPQVLVKAFTEDPEVIALASIAVRIAAFEQATIAIEMSLAGALRGAGETRVPMIVSFIGLWVIRIPLLYVVINILHLGLAAIWVVTVIDWFCRASLLVWYFKKGTWKKIKLDNDE